MKSFYLICSSLFLVSLFSCNNTIKKKTLDAATERQELQETQEVVSMRIDDLKFEPIKIIEVGFNKSNNLQEVFYGLSKDSIRIVFTSDNPIEFLNIVEERSGKVVKQFRNISEVDLFFEVLYDNPFSLNIEFIKDTYYDLKIYKKAATIENNRSVVSIFRDSVVIRKKTNRSIAAKKIGFISVFNEPKKFIISKAMTISGESKIYVPIELPENVIEFIYTLRISGQDKQEPEDGKLFEAAKTSERNIKSFGLSLWQLNSKSNSLTREVLNGLFPPKKDKDYSLNVFFFDKEKEIKKYLNYSGKEYASAFFYDINNSALSSQSRIGLIKRPKTGYCYIGLQSTSSWTNTYVWLDAVAMYQKDFNYEIRYRLKKNIDQ
jgi:hypothetical protein